jgi:hypothetical protein
MRSLRIRLFYGCMTPIVSVFSAQLQTDAREPADVLSVATPAVTDEIV